MKYAILIVMTLLQTAPVFANCEMNALAGKWSRSVVDSNQVDSGESWIWNFGAEGLVATVQLTDSWTATGTYGPYFETETQYQADLAPDCTLVLKAGKSTERTFRNFDEPTQYRTETTTDGSGRVMTYRVVLENGGNRLTVTDEENVSVKFERQR